MIQALRKLSIICLCLLGSSCVLVTVPVKTAGSIVNTTVRTTGSVVEAPFKAVGGRSREDKQPESEPTPEDEEVDE